MPEQERDEKDRLLKQDDSEIRMVPASAREVWTRRAGQRHATREEAMAAVEDYCKRKGIEWERPDG